VGEDQSTGESVNQSDPGEVAVALRETLYEEHDLYPSVIMGILQRLEAEAEAEMECLARSRVKKSRRRVASRSGSQSTPPPEYIR
jgi:hypothetical protein